MLARMDHLANMISDALNGRGVANNAGVSSISDTPVSADAQYNLYCWGGRYHKLPELYRFPLGATMHTMWLLFYFGDRNQNLPPFRCLGCTDFGNRNDATYLSKVRIIAHIIAMLAFKANKFIIPGINSNDAIAVPSKKIDNALIRKSVAEMQEIFKTGYEILLTLVHPDNPRSVQVSYSTLHKRIGEYDKIETTDIKLSSLVKYR